MSALALQIESFSLAPRSVPEVELLRAISHISWNAVSEEDALKSIAAAILRAPDLTGFRVEPAEEAGYLPLYEATKQQPKGGIAWALAPISANGKNWGRLRVFFLPQTPSSAESPVRLAKFVGQQIAILLDRLHLERQNRRELARVQALERGIRRRKAIHRASAILSGQRNVSLAEATSILVRYARRRRIRLLPIAESLILGFDALDFTRPALRRLDAAETTAPYFESAKGTKPCRHTDEGPGDKGGLGVPVLRGFLERSIA
jgi:hypothetical protein